MIKAILVREQSTQYGTFGRMCVYATEFMMCFDTLELPWLSNLPCRSCIPDGKYRCQFGETGKGRLYQVLNVPLRSGILIHAGNLAGDRDANLKSDTEGCVLIGHGRTDDLQGQPGILKSREALKRFHDFTQGIPFDLDIRWKFIGAERTITK
ncbi:MAG TPA: DUF5675 family protein [Kiritimatiellia bacterium]|nr:DUF5675 family protein [Kiritimatiellia bacterium]